MANKKQQNSNYDLESWKYRQALRSSNAAQKHVPQTRKGTRAFKRQKAIKDQQENESD